jgi:hypothetical protein
MKGQTTMPDTVVRILGPRPVERPAPHQTPIPRDAEIWNGPYMLFGTMQDGMGLTWLGEPIAASGAYYGAILADDPLAEEWRAFNRDLGGIVVEYVNFDQVRQALRAHYANVVGMEPGDIETMMGHADQRTLWLQYTAAALHTDRVLA